MPANNLGSITFPAVQLPAAHADQRRWQPVRQAGTSGFVYENLGLLDDRILLSGGVSRFFGDLVRTDTNGIPPAITFPSYDLSTTAKNVEGGVGKVKGVSVFYGYNTTGGTMPSSLNPGTYGPTFRAASGTQIEYGVSSRCLRTG